MGELKLKRPLFIIDVETTGVDIERDRVISLGVAVFGQSQKPLEFRFNPGMPIPPEATAVHGITDADVADMPSFAQAAKRIVDFLAGGDIAGFNIRAFDVPLLTAEFRRAGIRWPSEDVTVVDAFRIYNRMEPRTLSAALRYYVGKEHDGAHGAAADVAACADVIEQQAVRYGAVTLTDLTALERDPSWLDQDGKVRWLGDVAVIGFGKWAGRPLAQVDRSYLDWMLRQEFPADTKEIIAAALRGHFPARRSA